jgi:hypothetical protein
MFKIISLVGLLPCLLFAAAPAPAAAVSGSNCAYAITKLQAQIKFEQGVKNTAPASAAAADALASNAKAEAGRRSLRRGLRRRRSDLARSVKKSLSKEPWKGCRNDDGARFEEACSRAF